eukprot:CAMPEP_0182446846 /NCGR_PEP_ID=MMETSP1172-20130603/7458_1 /TAXON_ID=708627 /ORGANISM="Timspurckia oligopyrenoides, Strain CCMP3278" /LENGTH=504 /DNA_ID=CAMNT_0024642981 /DNA_START=57 /DNA_END=1571 /DNA_ORIENTATION=+
MINPENIESVAVIGAGVSGLQVANLLLKEGKDVTVYEKCDDIGGTWRKGYDDYGLQIGRNLYRFCEPGFVRQEVEPYCKATKLLEYIKSYAELTNVMKVVKLNKEMVSLGQDQKSGKWILKFSDGQVIEKDFVVIATGQFVDPKPLPVGAKDGSTCEIDNLHSRDFGDASVVKGKRFVVTGIGKSGIDCAVLAVRNGAKSVTVLSRKPYYLAGRKIFNLIPMEWVYYSRVGGWIIPPDYNAGFASRALHKLFFPLKWMIFRMIEWEMKFSNGPHYSNLGIQYVPFPESAFLNGGQVIVTPEFGELVDQGVIDVKFGSIQSYDGNAILFSESNGSLVEVSADFVVNATGYNRSYDYFELDVKSKLDLQSDGLWLYRRILPATGIDNLAFVGCECVTFNTIESSFFQSKWLAEAISGRMPLPSSEECLKDVQKLKNHYRKICPRAPHLSGEAVPLRSVIDTYLQDMGISKYRKYKSGYPILGILSEIFQYYTPADYEDLASAKASS